MSQENRPVGPPTLTLVHNTGFLAGKRPVRESSSHRFFPAGKPTAEDGTEIALPWNPQDPPPFLKQVDLLTAWCIEEHTRVRAAHPNVPDWQIVRVEIPHVLCITDDVGHAVVAQLDTHDLEAELYGAMFPVHKRYHLCMRDKNAAQTLMRNYRS